MTNLDPLSPPGKRSIPDRLTVGRIDLFQGLDPEALEEVAALAETAVLRKGQWIFEQGADAHRAYVAITGSVRIQQSGSDGAQVVIRFIAPGEMFGTLALFTDHLYPADAIAMADAVVMSWAEKDVLALLERHSRIGLNALRIVCARLGEAQNRIRELSTQRAERRVAYAVLRLAVQAGDTSPDGTTITIPLRRQDIAEVSGTTLHTASRILTTWERAGYLTSENRTLTVGDLAAIRNIAEHPPY